MVAAVSLPAMTRHLRQRADRRAIGHPVQQARLSKCARYRQEFPGTSEYPRGL